MLEKMKALFQATDMTEGTPWKRIVIFTVPMLLGNIAQQLYSTVDTLKSSTVSNNSLRNFFNEVELVITLAIILFIYMV